MSRFYADISGGRGTATRQGHTASGIRGHVRGWDGGIYIIGTAVDSEPPTVGSVDKFDVYATGGSRGATPDLYLGSFIVDAESSTWQPGRGTAVDARAPMPRR